MLDWYRWPIADSNLVPRVDMPQVDESDYPALVNFLQAHSCPVSRIVIEPQSCRFHQSVDDFDPSRIFRMPLDKPILLARDRFILDGNHRVKANLYLGRPLIHAIELNRDFEASIALLFAFPRTTVTANG